VKGNALGPEAATASVTTGATTTGLLRMTTYSAQYHTLEAGGTNHVSSNVHSVFGHQSGQVEGFSYTHENKQKGVI